MEQPREVPLELFVGLREELGDVRAKVGELDARVTHLAADVVDVKQDIRRVDDRMFQLMLLQLGTLATAFASLVAAIS